VSDTITYHVPGMSCDHCKRAISAKVGSVAGVTRVDVDLDSKLVVVTGDDLDDRQLRTAIEDAGYEIL